MTDQTPSPQSVVDWSEYQDDISDAISESVDLDWNANDGARAVVRWLNENASMTAPQAEALALRTLLDNLVIAQCLSKEIREHATSAARSYLYNTRRAAPAPSSLAGGEVEGALDQELIDRGLRTIRAYDAVRFLRDALSATTARLIGYDWNADPEGLTKQQGDAFALADKVFADLSAAVDAHPDIELPECQACGGTGKIEEAARTEGANQHSACVRSCEDCDGCGFAPNEEPSAILAALSPEAPARERVTHPDAQPFEQFPELALHIERMAMTGLVGSGISWDAFLRELNAAIAAAPAPSSLAGGEDSAFKVATDLHAAYEALIYGLPKYLEAENLTDEENMIREAWIKLDVTAHRLAALSPEAPARDGVEWFGVTGAADETEALAVALFDVRCPGIRMTDEDLHYYRAAAQRAMRAAAEELDTPALTPRHEAPACSTCGGKGYTEHEGGDGEGYPSRPEIDDCPRCHKAPAEPVSDHYRFDDEIAWLREAARYFSARDTQGEDRAHWANAYNAENARKLADRLAELSSNPCQLEAPAEGAGDCLRPEVRAFAQLMEGKLRANDWKGGWKNDFSGDLLRRAHEELGELDDEMASGDPDLFDNSAIANEAADVANMLMMVVDVCGALPALRPPSREPEGGADGWRDNPGYNPLPGELVDIRWGGADEGRTEDDGTLSDGWAWNTSQGEDQTNYIQKWRPHRAAALATREEAPAEAGEVECDGCDGYRCVYVGSLCNPSAQPQAREDAQRSRPANPGNDRASDYGHAIPRKDRVMTAPTTRETADHIGEANEKVADHIGDATTMIDHAELADQASRDLEWSCLTTIRPTALLELLSETAALRGERDRIAGESIWWRGVIGDASHQPSGEVPSIKHMHPAMVKPIYDAHKGTAVADVIAGLIFSLAINQNREQFLVKHANDRATQAERQRDELRKALEEIADEAPYRSGYCQSDVEYGPALSADEMQAVARQALANQGAE